MLRRSWARACLSPGPLQPRGNRAVTPLKAGYRNDSPEVCVWMDRWGWSRCLWNVRVWPGSTCSCTQLPPGHWHEVTPPWVGTPHSVLHLSAQPDLPRKEAQCLALGGGQGLAGGCSLHHRSGQLPQEAPRVPVQASLLGAALGRGLKQAKVLRPGPQGPEPLPVLEDASTLAVRCRVTVRTPESMHICFCF